MLPRTESSTSQREEGEAAAGDDANQRVRERLRQRLDAGKLDDRKVTLTVEQRQTPVHVLSNLGMENLDVDLQSVLDRLSPRGMKSRELTVADARKVLIEQETDRLIDRESAGERAVKLAEESGIIFIDELDKVAGDGSGRGPDVSRQGVQRDLLPIVEGTAVQTRYGVVRTEYILFIAAGAFHMTKPSDLMPELQGRFPIRVELKDLGRGDMVRILKEPKNSLIRQYAALLGAEGFELSFTDDALEAVAEIADAVNKTTENIGARRLHTILEKLLEEPSFDAPTATSKRLRIDADYVRRKLAKISADQDLSKFIL
jgi:ATP-dependent HslUV protease ATP-binding subunit HslU